MSNENIPFIIPDGAIGLDLEGNQFHLGSTGPMFVYPLARTVQQAQHLHSLWLRCYATVNDRIRYNNTDREQAEADYQRAREIIALANRIENT